MKHYRLISAAGLDLGVYAAESEEDALDVMARDAGYRDQAGAAEVAGPWDGQIVEESEPSDR